MRTIKLAIIVLLVTLFNLYPCHAMFGVGTGTPRLLHSPAYTDIYELSKAVAEYARFVRYDTTTAPYSTTVPPLTLNYNINGALHRFEIYYYKSSLTISSSTNFGTSTTDDAIVMVVSPQDITVNSGTVTTSVRKRGLIVYAEGTLTVNSGATISMSARGAYWQPTGALALFTNGGTSIYIPAVGGGANGGAGTNGGCGGGGAGGRYNGGAAGTGYSGGAGAGGSGYGGVTGGTSYGGPGGNGGTGHSKYYSGGGAGNPGGTGWDGYNPYNVGGTGNGGLLILMASSMNINSGANITASGAAGGNSGICFATYTCDGGGGSGGGSINIFSKSLNMNGTLSATGGSGGTCTYSGGTCTYGQAGGNGTVRYSGQPGVPYLP